MSGQLLVLEVDCRDLDPTLLRPDEDYLVQMQQVTWASQPSEYDAHVSQVPHLWPQSLARLGSVAVAGTILPDAITRYAVVEDLYDVVHDYYRAGGDHDIHLFHARCTALTTALEYLFHRKMQTDFAAGHTEGELRAMYPRLSREEIVNFGYLAEFLWVGYPRCRRAARKRLARSRGAT